MTRYHINFEGKIYPCKAKIHKCPYGEEFHSTSKVELYYKLMGAHGVDTKPSNMALDEIERTGRIKSLYSSSQAIAQVDYPVDVAVATLQETLVHLEDEKTKEKIEKWKKFEEESIEDVRRAYLNGQTRFPPSIPQEIIEKGRLRFNQLDRGKALEQSNKAETKERLERINRRLQEKAPYFPAYLKQDKKGLNYKNYESTYSWVAHDFEKFSHDLNTSKMITQPIFYGSISKAKDTISKMDDYELLSVYDDYSISDREIHKNVKDANYFEYKYRDDLSKSANKSMETWYNRNKEIYNNWKINTPKRILLSMEIAKELDKRGVLRQDNSHGAVIS